MDKNYLDTLKDNIKSKKPHLGSYVKTSEAIILNEQKNKDISVTIIEWFVANSYPKDKDVHKFAESLGIKPDLLEEKIYAVLSSFLSEGRSKNFKGTYNAKEIKMGIKIEIEHTTDTLISEKISKDHLAEIPDYYTRLNKMEKEAGIE